MCMTKKSVTALFSVFFFFSLSLFYFFSPFQLLPSLSCGALLHDQRNSVGRETLVQANTWLHLNVFILFCIFRAGRGGVWLCQPWPYWNTLPYFPSVVCVWRKSFDVHYFWYKKQFEKKKRNKKKSKTHIISKSTFSVPFKKLSRFRTLQHWNLVCWLVSLCQVQRFFQNKARYCEATLIKETFSLLWFVSSWVQVGGVDTMLTQRRIRRGFFTTFALW